MYGYLYYSEIMDDQLALAIEYAEEIVPLTDSELFFEDASEKTENNNKAMNSAANAFHKAVEAVQKFIQNIIDTIKDFWEKMRMSKDERSNFEEYVKKMAKDPRFKDKVFRVKDYRKMMEIYDHAIKEVDAGIAAAEKAKDDEQEEIANQTRKKADKILDTIHNATLYPMGMDAVLRFAESNRTVAWGITKLLGEESKIVKEMNEVVGKKRTDKFVSRVKSSSKLLSLHKFKCWLLGEKHKGLVSVCRQIMDDFGVGSKDMDDAIDNELDERNAGNAKRFFTKAQKTAARAVARGRIANDGLGVVGTATGKDLSVGKTVKKGVPIVAKAAGMALDARKMFKNTVSEVADAADKQANRMDKLNRRYERDIRKLKDRKKKVDDWIDS